jgi:hypothetical protein
MLQNPVDRRGYFLSNKIVLDPEELDVEEEDAEKCLVGKCLHPCFIFHPVHQYLVTVFAAKKIESELLV